MFLFLVLSMNLWGAPTVTCPKAQAGQTVTCSASGGTAPYTWSLTAGSAGSINASTGEYTAPTTVTVQQKSGPCQMLPPDHIFNTRIDALPVHADSATIIALGGSTTYHITVQPAWSLNIIDNSTGTFAAVFKYTSTRNGDFQIAPYPSLYRESGYFTPPFSNVDRHVIAVNRDTCEFSDIYNNYNAGDNVVQSCPLCTAQSGIKYSNSFQLPDTSISANGATDAASMYLQPLSIHLSDMQAGVIKHAIRMTMSNSWINASYQWPAEANAGAYCSGICWKYGMYSRLKSSVDISGYSATAQIILTAMKQYGMIISDGGTSYGITADGELMLDPNCVSAIAEILNGSLRNGDLEVVDVSSLMDSTYSGSVNLSNGYVTPAQFAEAVATDNVSAVGKSRVVLEGVTVGVSEPSMVIMAGVQVQLQAWVKGSPTPTMSWSMSPSVGTLSSGGLYTAPSGISSPTTTRVTITADAEATAHAYIDILVWPDNDGGAIRQVPAKTTNLTYGGHTWWGKTYTRARGWGAPGSWGNICPAGTPNTDSRYSYDDTIFKYWLPNGNYSIRLYQCVPTSYNPLDSNEFIANYDTQGSVAFTDLAEVDTVGSGGTAGYLDMTASVTDNTLYIGIRNRVSTNPYQNIAGIEIVPIPSSTKGAMSGGVKLSGGAALH